MPRAVHIIEEGPVAASALHPVRREILSELSEPESAAGLARRIGMPRQQVNYHIRRLEAQGLVELVGERRVRNCLERLVQAVGHSYVISPTALGEIAADPQQIEDEGSAAYLVAVASQTIREAAALQLEPGRAREDPGTLTLRAEIRFRSRGAQVDFSTELGEQLARLVAKYHVPLASKGQPLRILATAYPVPGDE